MNFLRTILLLTPLLVAACATPGPNTDYLDDDGYSRNIAAGGKDPNPDIVRVVQQEQFKNMLLVKREAGSPVNQHPVTIDAEELGKRLKSIRVRHGKDKPRSLFDDDHPQELREFSKWLAQALAEASPDTDILFNFPQERGMGFLSEHVMLTGRAFVIDDQLNIIFSHIADYYQGQWLRANMVRKFNRPSRQQSVLEGREVVDAVKAPRAQPARGDWVQISLADAAPAARATAPAPTGQLRAAERLQKLQSLKDKGLINDEEYQQKRQQILNDL